MKVKLTSEWDGSPCNLTRGLMLSLLFLLYSCGSVAPLNKVEGGWKKYNHKTQYALEDKGENHIYLNVTYSAYTFTDKATEAIPTTKTLFRQITKDLAKHRGDFTATYDENEFYENTAYNGITGISKVLVSNDVKFLPINKLVEDKKIDLHKAKINTLEDALKHGLLTQDEFNKKKEQLLTPNK